MDPGHNEFFISGDDLAGNSNDIKVNFYFDDIRPDVEITNKGFIVSDNLELLNDSLMLDNKRYSFDNCHLITDEYHCRYDKWIKTIRVQDIAGNSFMKEYKLVRS